jgi:hypothetical protein
MASFFFVLGEVFPKKDKFNMIIDRMIKAHPQFHKFLKNQSRGYDRVTLKVANEWEKNPLTAYNCEVGSGFDRILRRLL